MLAENSYKHLEACFIISTLERLISRISERFPEAGLKQLSQNLLSVAKGTESQIRVITRPIYSLRALSALLVSLILVAIVGLILALKFQTGELRLVEFLQATEAAVNELILVGALIFFVVSLEIRIKRKWALAAIHELRSIAHIIDMLQLTKDPERLSEGRQDTPSSPQNVLSHFELSRYLDYCSELLALIGKLAALYGQNLSDAVTLSAVNEIEDLTNGLSRKIWQKLMILHFQRA